MRDSKIRLLGSIRRLCKREQKLHFGQIMPSLPICSKLRGCSWSAMVAIIIHRSEQNANSPNHYSGSLFSSIHQTLGSTLAGKIVHMYSWHKNVSWRKALSERNQNSQFPRSLFSKPESTVCQKCADPLTLSWILASFRSDIPITSKFQESVPNPHDFEIYFFLH